MECDPEVKYQPIQPQPQPQTETECDVDGNPEVKYQTKQTQTECDVDGYPEVPVDEEWQQTEQVGVDEGGIIPNLQFDVDELVEFAKFKMSDFLHLLTDVLVPLPDNVLGTGTGNE